MKSTKTIFVKRAVLAAASLVALLGIAAVSPALAQDNGGNNNNGGYSNGNNNSNDSSGGYNNNNGNYNYNSSNGQSQAFINNGAVLPIVMDTKLSSSSSWDGEKFKAHLAQNQDGKNYNVPDGAVILGHVVNVQPTQGQNTGVIQLSFDRIKLPNGEYFPIRAVATNADTSGVTVQRDGSIIAQQPNLNKRAANDVGIGAAVGRPWRSSVPQPCEHGHCCPRRRGWLWREPDQYGRCAKRCRDQEGYADRHAGQRADQPSKQRIVFDLQRLSERHWGVSYCPGSRATKFWCNTQSTGGTSGGGDAGA